MTVGSLASGWQIHLYSDADLAKCPFTKRSTSGVYAELVGPKTMAPIIGQSARQTATSESTPEAELVAASKAIVLLHQIPNSAAFAKVEPTHGWNNTNCGAKTWCVV